MGLEESDVARAVEVEEEVEVVVGIFSFLIFPIGFEEVEVVDVVATTLLPFLLFPIDFKGFFITSKKSKDGGKSSKPKFSNC